MSKHVRSRTTRRVLFVLLLALLIAVLPAPTQERRLPGAGLYRHRLHSESGTAHFTLPVSPDSLWEIVLAPDFEGNLTWRLLDPVQDAVTQGGTEREVAVISPRGARTLEVIVSGPDVATEGDFVLLVTRVRDWRTLRERVELAARANDYDVVSRYTLLSTRLRPKQFRVADAAVAAATYRAGEWLLREARYLDARFVSTVGLDILLELTEGRVVPDVGLTMSQIGMANTGLARYEEAADHYERALTILAKTYGTDHPLYATVLGNLAGSFNRSGQPTQALGVLREALEIQRIVSGRRSTNYAVVLNNIGKTLMDLERLDEADAALRDAASIFEEAEGRGAAGYAAAMENRGGVAFYRGNYAAARQFYEAAAENREARLGPDHPVLAATLQNVARTFREQGHYERALPYHRQALESAQLWIARSLPALRADERERFLRGNSGYFTSFYAFARRAAGTGLPIGELLYDLILFRKTILLRSEERLQRRILESGDVDLIADFSRWRSLVELLARSSGEDDVAAVRDRARKLESRLARESTTFRDESVEVAATWQAVQASLQPNEAAIEMVRFEDEDEVVYAVVILTSDRPPRAIFLENGREIEEEAYEAYRDWITSMEAPGSFDEWRFQERWGGDGVPVLHDHLFEALWAPVEHSIAEIADEEVDTLYLSPDGVYALVNLSIIEHEGVPIGTRRALHLVTSTRRLPEARLPAQESHDENAAPGSIVLLGNPRYETHPPSEPAGRSAREVTVLTGSGISGQKPATPVYRWDGTPLAPLRETEEAIGAIAKRVRASESGMEARLLVREAASELNVEAESPRASVLHLATHGFFLEGEDAGADPLQNGGLYLAGAQDSLFRGGPPPGSREDGILTGAEAALLDLRGAQLVVLSACETGRGEVRSAEGVYGLLRGFYAAGARSVIVSRWRVDERATIVFMDAFYEEWLAGRSVAEAFSAARELVRANPEFHSPYYWGAFELVDGI